MFVLRRQPGLMTFNVAYASVPGAPQIDYALERFERGERVFQKTWRRDVVTPGTSAADRLELPTALPDTLAEAISAAGPASGEPLWLHLVKPYGLLGIARWEHALAEATGRPIFRLPDFLAKSSEFEDALDCAILWDLRADAVDDRALDASITAWLEGSNRGAVCIHVLATDAVQRERLSRRWRDRAGSVVVHMDYARDDGAVPDIRVPAFEWVERATNGLTLDVLQVAAAAELGDNAATLMFNGAGPGLPRCSASVAELATLLNRLGAWCTAISGTAGAPSEPALRYFADALAQARPGPSLYHALTGGTDDDLRTTCAVLFTAEEVVPPSLTGGFLYCTPSLMTDDVVELAAGAVPSAPSNDLVTGDWPDSGSGSPGQPPAWVAAAQRVCEEITLEHSRGVAGDNLLQDLLQQAPLISEALRNGRAGDVVQQAVDDIQSIVRQAAVEVVAVRWNAPE